MSISDKVWSRIVTMIGRKTYYQEHLDRYGMNAPAKEEADMDTANLVSSELPNGMHAPALDLDFACHLVPSSTMGKFHLYIDKEITWDQYRHLLNGFYRAGLIEYEWYQNAMRDERTYVRLPHVKKPPKVVPDYGNDPSPF